MCATCVSGECRRQERASDPMELELWVIINCHMDAGNSAGPLQEQPVCLMAEPSLLSCDFVFNWSNLFHPFSKIEAVMWLP